MNNDQEKLTIGTSLSELLSKEDYQNFRHVILLRNDTSGISHMTDQEIFMKEVGTDYASLVMPEKLCANGHNLTLFFFSSPLKKQLKKLPMPTDKNCVQVMGKVSEKETIGEDICKLLVKFTQYNMAEWNSICDKYTAKQEKLNDFLNGCKE